MKRLNTFRKNIDIINSIFALIATWSFAILGFLVNDIKMIAFVGYCITSLLIMAYALSICFNRDKVMKSKFKLFGMYVKEEEDVLSKSYKDRAFFIFLLIGIQLTIGLLSFYNHLESKKPKCLDYSPDEYTILIADFVDRKYTAKNRTVNPGDFAYNLSSKAEELGPMYIAPKSIHTFYNPFNERVRIIDTIPQVKKSICPFNGVLVYGVKKSNFVNCNMEFMLENDSLDLILNDERIKLSLPREVNIDQLDSDVQLNDEVDALWCLLDARLKLAKKDYRNAYKAIDSCSCKFPNNKSFMFYVEYIKGLSLLPLGFISEGRQCLTNCLNSGFQFGLKKHKEVIDLIYNTPDSLFHVDRLSLSKLKELSKNECETGNDHLCIFYKKRINLLIEDLERELYLDKNILNLQMQVDSLVNLTGKEESEAIDSLRILLLNEKNKKPTTFKEPNKDSLFSRVAVLEEEVKYLRAINTELESKVLNIRMKEPLRASADDYYIDPNGDFILLSKDIKLNGKNYSFGQTIIQLKFKRNSTELIIPPKKKKVIDSFVELVSKYSSSIRVKIVGTAYTDKKLARSRALAFTKYLRTQYPNEIPNKKSFFLIGTPIETNKSLIRVSIIKKNIN